MRATEERSPRQELNFNTNWEFVRAEHHPEAGDREGWETVHLPHTPRVEPGVASNSWQGVCWYRRRFVAEPAWQGKKVTAKFEAVMQQAEVWVNGRKMTTHEGGYLPFCVEVTDALTYDGRTENTILVRADNRDCPDIPPGKPQKQLDFTYQGGIYREVQLILTDKLHITDAVAADRAASGGIFVSFPEVTAECATVQVKTHVVNGRTSPASFQIESTLLDREGKAVLTETTATTALNSGQDRQFEQTLRVTAPNFWHANSPRLSVRTCTLWPAGQNGYTTWPIIAIAFCAPSW